jgi:hypothetical protein
MTEREIPLAQQLGLVSAAVGEAGHSHSHTFALPCPRHREGRCSTYGNRMPVCGSYQCRLLARYLRREVTLEHALGQVRKVDAALDALALRLGPRPADQPVWAWLQAWRKSAKDGASEESRRRHGETLLQVAVLAAMLEREFGFRKPGDVLPA